MYAIQITKWDGKGSTVNLMDVQEEMGTVMVMDCAILIPDNVSVIRCGLEPTVAQQIVQVTHLVQVMAAVMRPQSLAGVTVIKTGQGRVVMCLVSTEQITVMPQDVSATSVTMASDVKCYVRDMAVVTITNVYVMQALDIKGFIVIFRDVLDGQRIAVVMVHVT